MKYRKVIKKINKEYLTKLNYIKYYEELPVENNIIFLEAQNGRNSNGNIFYIAQELNNNKEYKNYKIYLSINKKGLNNTKKFFIKHGLNNVILVA